MRTVKKNKRFRGGKINMYIQSGVICYIIITICIGIYKLTIKNEPYEAVNFFMNMCILILIGIITCNVIYG